MQYPHLSLFLFLKHHFSHVSMNGDCSITSTTWLVGGSRSTHISDHLSEGLRGPRGCELLQNKMHSRISKGKKTHLAESGGIFAAGFLHAPGKAIGITLLPPRVKRTTVSLGTGHTGALPSHS